MRAQLLIKVTVFGSHDEEIVRGCGRKLYGDCIAMACGSLKVDVFEVGEHELRTEASVLVNTHSFWSLFLL